MTARIVPNRPDDGYDGPDDLAGPHGVVWFDIVSAAELAAIVDALPAPDFLARPVWPGDAYGVIGAEDKAGKTWAVADLAVAVASGKAWLGQFPCDQPGPVLVFLGEGGQRKMLRRFRAVAEYHRVRLEDLPIRVCFRVPHLKAHHHVAAVTAELAEHPARLVIIDPLYLAAAGANGADLYAMGEHLSGIQQAAQDAGAALVIVTHWNKTGTGKGRERFTGAGPAAWGRVLCSMSVEGERRTEDTASVVTIRAEFIGDETPDTVHSFDRRVWTDDPDDLSSPMHYRVEPASITGPDEARATLCIDALRTLFAELGPGTELAQRNTLQALRDAGHSYRDAVVRTSLERLVADSTVTSRTGQRGALYYRLTDHRQGTL